LPCQPFSIAARVAFGDELYYRIGSRNSGIAAPHPRPRHSFLPTKTDSRMSNAAPPNEPLRYYGQPDPFGLGQLVEGWRARELLYSFFLRDLLIRYRQVFVGVLWVLLQPLLSTLIFLGLLFVLGAGNAGTTIRYAPVILIGMLCWQLVNNSLRDATGSLVNYRHVVTKIYFPRMLLPLSSLMCAVFDLLVSSILIIPMCWLTGVAIRWSTMWIAPLAVVGLIVFCFGCILWLSSLNAQYRDVGYALPFALQIGMFVSPVVYDAQRLLPILGPNWQWLYEANPVAANIGLARWAILGEPFPTLAGLIVAYAVTAMLAVSGLAWFRYADQWMADRI
jgi:lipopolysaccharide transport system permease protein